MKEAWPPAYVPHPLPEPARSPSPSCHIPRTESARPISWNNAEKELRHRLPTNSHPNPPVLLGIGRFLHLCARFASPQVRGRSGPASRPVLLYHWLRGRKGVESSANRRRDPGRGGAWGKDLVRAGRGTNQLGGQTTFLELKHSEVTPPALAAERKSHPFHTSFSFQPQSQDRLPFIGSI